MNLPTEVAVRRRGRPHKSGGPPTSERLLDAAEATCVAQGFEGVTVAGIADHVGMTPTAIYNHFPTKDELLYAAGRRALQRLLARLRPANGHPEHVVVEVAMAYLDPDMATTRALLLELHMAAIRHPALAAHLQAWHREFSQVIEPVTPGSPAERRATVKTLFLLLLGLCHLDHLGAVRADSARLGSAVTTLVQTLYPPDLADPAPPATTGGDTG